MPVGKYEKQEGKIAIRECGTITPQFGRRYETEVKNLFPLFILPDFIPPDFILPDFILPCFIKKVFAILHAKIVFVYRAADRRCRLGNMKSGRKNRNSGVWDDNPAIREAGGEEA